MFSLARLFSAYRLMEQRYTAEMSSLNVIIQELKESHAREIESLNVRYADVRSDKERDWEQRVRTDREYRELQEEYRLQQTLAAREPITPYQKKRIEDMKPPATNGNSGGGAVIAGGFKPASQMAREASAASLLKKQQREAQEPLTPEQRAIQIPGEARRFTG